MSVERKVDPSMASAKRRYEVVRDFLKACEKVWGEAWGSGSHMVTRPVTIKAMLRVRFPAKGQVERVARIHRELSKHARVEPSSRAARGGD